MEYQNAHARSSVFKKLLDPNWKETDAVSREAESVCLYSKEGSSNLLGPVGLI